MAAVEEKKAWVGWQPDGDATVRLRTDLQMPREAEQVAGLRRRRLGEEGSAGNFAVPARGAHGGAAGVLLSFNFPVKGGGPRMRAPGGREKVEEGWGQGGRELIFFIFSD